MTAASTTHIAMMATMYQSKSTQVVKCTETNIPIPYLVYASPTPGTKGWQSIKKQKTRHENKEQFNYSWGEMEKYTKHSPICNITEKVSDQDY